MSTLRVDTLQDTSQVNSVEVVNLLDRSQLSANTGAALVGTTSGSTVQAVLNNTPLKTNNLSDLPSPATARTNLGLGSAAIESVVPVIKGGTGGTSPSTARTNLGVPAGTTPQLSSAWGIFNGTGLTTLRAGYNVTSVVRTATGRYLVTFITPLSSANYAALANHTNTAGSLATQKTAVGDPLDGGQSASQFAIGTVANGNYYNPEICSFVCFGGL